jgi:hypothetical protein
MMVVGKPYNMKYPPEDLFLLVKIPSLPCLLSSCTLKVEPPVSGKIRYRATQEPEHVQHVTGTKKIKTTESA